MIVERPFKNFLDLILFPKSSIFKKQKDLEDSDESSDDDKDSDEGVKDGPHKGNSKQKKIMCGFCQDQVCDCKCLINKKKCKCVGNLQNTIIASPSKKKPKTLLKDTIQEVYVTNEVDVGQSMVFNKDSEFENGFKRKIEDSMLDSTIKGTLIGDNKLTKSEMEKKRVSFNVFNVKR